MGQPPSKTDVMRALLERSEARVYLDARRPGVMLPPHLLTEAQLRLDYSYGFSPPIPDLVVDERGISATLSFNSRVFSTFVPWEAIYLIADYDGNGAVWQDDIPGEVLERVASALEEAPKPLASLDTVGGTSASPPPIPPARPSRPKLVAIPDGEARPDSSDVGAGTSTSDDPEPPRPRPTLRLVK